MPLRRLGEKLKTSLHHLSPKSKKTDEYQGGDLSPCSLPPTATSAAAQLSAPPPISSEDQAGAAKPCAKANECLGTGGVNKQKLAKDKTPVRTGTPAPTITTADPDCPPGNFTNCMHPSEVGCSTYALRLQGNGAPQLDKDTVSIAGDYVERVTVTVKPEEETTDVYVDLLEGGHLYDKIRVQVRQSN
ncbi:hypothetical protein Esti_004191 [Eimeria stiedai]